MEAIQGQYIFNTYDPISLTIQSYSQTITHYENLETFIVNINDQVDLLTKSAIDEFILTFERKGFCFISEGCWLAVKEDNKQEETYTLEELAKDHLLFGYLAFGQNQDIRLNTATVLQVLNTKEKRGLYKNIYRINDHSIIYPSMFSLLKRRYEKHPEESRRFFYLLRDFDLNLSTKRGNFESIPFGFSYFQLFLTTLMKNEDAGYELDNQQLRTIGAIEFEIRDLVDLDWISQLIKNTLDSEEFEFATGNPFTMNENGIHINETIPF